jgi:hypothetical protein
MLSGLTVCNLRPTDCDHIEKGKDDAVVPHNRVTSGYARSIWLP